MVVLHFPCISSQPQLMRNRSFLFFFISTILFSISCTDELGTDFTIIQTSAQLQYYAMESFDGALYAVGGGPWERGDIAVSLDGIDWEVSYLGNRGIFDLHATDNRLLAVGNDGYIYSGVDQDLHLLTPRHNNMLRAITEVPDGYVIVGGKDWNKGWLYKTDQEGNVLSERIIEHQLSDVKCDGKGNCIATGYGIIMKSADYGFSWVVDEQIGDFYKSIAYHEDGTAYVVGHRGSLIYQQPGGSEWISIKKGHSPIGTNTPFRKIKFYAGQGYVVGDNGTIWHSTDGGQNWSNISIDTELDLYDFIIAYDRLYIASESGRIIVVDL